MSLTALVVSPKIPRQPTWTLGSGMFSGVAHRDWMARDGDREGLLIIGELMTSG